MPANWKFCNVILPAYLQHDGVCNPTASASEFACAGWCSVSMMKFYGGEVEAVHVVQDMADLNKLCKEYEKAEREAGRPH